MAFQKIHLRILLTLLSLLSRVGASNVGARVSDVPAAGVKEESNVCYHPLHIVHIVHI